MDTKIQTLEAQLTAIQDEADALRREIIELKLQFQFHLQAMEQPQEGQNIECVVNQREDPITDEEDGIQKEIIKSIVYAALDESVNSLRMISSLGASNVVKWNVFSFMVAYVIGGLVVLGQRLWDLRGDRDDRHDSYVKLLGQRQNLLLHVVIVFVSYLLFGLLPPSVYWFVLHGYAAYDKLSVVIPLSFIFISSLAAAKAYVRRPPKQYLKTIITYLIMGFLIFCISFVQSHSFQ